MNYNYINKSTGNLFPTEVNYNNKKLLNKNPSYNDILNKSRNINYPNLSYNDTEKISKDHVTQKVLMQLKNKELELTKDISKLIHNEKLIKDKSYLQITHENTKNSNLEKIKLQSELKRIDENKNISLSRLNEIKYRINSIEDKLLKETGIYSSNCKEKLSLFIHNQVNLKKNDKVNARLKQLQEQNNKLFLNMNNDAKNKLKEREEKLKLEEKKEKENNIKLLEQRKAEEKQKIILRKNKMNEEAKKIKKYINKRPKVKEYFYQKINTDFNDKMNKEIMLENQKRKNYMNSVAFSNLNEFVKNYEILKVKKKLELEEKTKGLKKSWSERGVILSKYKNEIADLINEEEKNKQKEKQMIIDMKNKMKNKQINYSKKLEDNLITDSKQNDTIKNNTNDNNKNKKKDNFKPNIKFNYINNYCDLIRNKILTKKSAESQKPLKLRPLNQIDLTKKQNSLNNINDPNLKLPNISTSNKNKINDDQINSSDLTKNKKLFRFNKNQEIKNLIQKNGFSESTLKMVNSKLENLKEKREQKEMLLKYQGGVASNPDLGEEVCDMLIDSVNAKMSIMDEMKKLSKKSNKNNLVEQGAGIDEYVSENDEEEEYENQD